METLVISVLSKFWQVNWCEKLQQLEICLPTTKALCNYWLLIFYMKKIPPPTEMKYKLHNCYQDSFQPRSQGSLSCFVTMNSSPGTSIIIWIWPKPRGSNIYSGTCYSLWKVTYRGEVCLWLFFWNNVFSAVASMRPTEALASVKFWRISPIIFILHKRSSDIFNASWY